MKSEDTLLVTGLSKRYSSKTGAGAGIDAISFDLESGTFFTLLGPSGCGKTTTLRCIAGLEQPDGGTIRLGNTVFFDSMQGTNVPLNRREIGMVFQSYAIWPHMTVYENVAFPLKVSKNTSYTRAEIRRLVGEALDTVNLGGYEQRSPTQMSGGQQQRVALARAIVRRPKLLLLDEPLSNLDALLREDMRRELKRLQQQIGITTVYVTHDQSEALEMSDTIAVLNQGEIIQIGAAHDIYNCPRDGFVAGFMGSPNLLGGVIADSVAADTLGKVTLHDGRVVCARFPHPVTSADAVAVSVRPEIISLKSMDAPLCPNTNRLSGIVVDRAFLGHSNRYGLKVGELTLQATVTAEIRFEVGAEVAVDFAFERTTGLVRNCKDCVVNPASRAAEKAVTGSVNLAMAQA